MFKRLNESKEITYFKLGKRTVYRFTLCTINDDQLRFQTGKQVLANIEEEHMDDHLSNQIDDQVT